MWVGKFASWLLAGWILAIGLLAPPARADDPPLILGCHIDHKIDVFQAGRPQSSSTTPGDKVYWIGRYGRIYVLSADRMSWDPHAACRMFEFNDNLVFCGFDEEANVGTHWIGRFVINRTTWAYSFESFDEPVAHGARAGAPAVGQRPGDYQVDSRTGACHPIVDPLPLAPPPTDYGSTIRQIAAGDHWFTYLQPSHGFRIDLPGHPSETDDPEDAHDQFSVEADDREVAHAEVSVTSGTSLDPAKFEAQIEALRDEIMKQHDGVSVVAHSVTLNGMTPMMMDISGPKDGGHVGIFRFDDGRAFIIAVSGPPSAELEATSQRIFNSFKVGAPQKSP